MRKLCFAILIVLNTLSLQGQSYKDYTQKGDSCYRVKNYRLSAAYFEKAFHIEEKNPAHLYKAACSAALSNETEKSFKWLNLALDNGYESLNYLKKDSDLETLHSQKKWKKLILKVQKKLDIIEADYDKSLQQELIAIFDDDQKVRKDYMNEYNDPKSNKKKLDSITELMIYKDSLNLIKIVKILDEKGWVGKDIVGSQANQTLFLVIQHSDLKTQQKYLPMMRDAVKKGNAKAASLALLEDRVALREGRKQIYGSQIAMNPVTRKNYISLLEDPDNVDKRRAEVGLGSLAEYVIKMNIIWDVEAYKKELPELEKLEKKI